MTTRRMLLVGLGATAFLAAAGFAGWVASLPPPPAPKAPPPIAEAEARATLAALAPPKRARPVVAVIGANGGTEVTDYLTTYGILRRADVAEVVALGTEPGPLLLYPTLKALPDATVAEFDARWPDGADYVVVPAMQRQDDPAVLQWIRAQAAKGATIFSVCAGARVVAAAGLLDGRRATTHWYYLDGLRKKHPEIRYAPDRRMVVDGGVVTTTGVTASMPAMLTLIEAIAGRPRAEAVAADLGMAAWDARHDSGAFRFNRRFAVTALSNRAAVWGHERLGVPLTPGVDEVSLALVADAWSRTYRSDAVSFAAEPGPVTTRSGLRLLPETVAEAWPAERRLPSTVADRPAPALDRALRDIGQRYGERTATFVAMQLEYPRSRPG